VSQITADELQRLCDSGQQMSDEFRDSTTLDVAEALTRAGVVTTLTPAELAERYYRLVDVEARKSGRRIIPWENMPPTHQGVFTEAAAALLRGGAS
jgi:hypothetical protein